MIAIRGLRVAFSAGRESAAVVFDGLDLDVVAGEWLAVAAPNGGGKTTLLRLLAGLVSPSAGNVRWNGPENPRIALMLQEPDNQFVASTVRTELDWSVPAAGAANGDRAVAGGDTSDAQAHRSGGSVDETIARFELDDLLRRNPRTLSGGEKQRVALASVVLQRPDLLLLDEPDAFLDAAGVRRCRDVVEELHANGTTIVWATPGGDALSWAGAIAVLGDRRCVFRGNPAAFFEWNALHPTAVVLPPAMRLCSRVARAASGTRPVRAADPGHEDGQARGDRVGECRNTGGCSVRFDNVRLDYRGGFSFGPASLEFPAGSCTGIAGGNAAGKTTLLRLAAGAEAPRGGSVSRILPGGDAPFAVEPGVYLMPQHPWRLFFCETVFDEIAWGIGRRGVRGVPTVDERVTQALVAAGLDAAGFRSRFPMHLSVGEKRRVALAIASSVDAQLLLLDEPTAGLDTDGAAALAGLLEHERRRGTTVVVSSHDIDLLCEVCDRVVTLKAGRVVSDVNTRSGDEPDDARWAGGHTPRIVDLQRELFRRGVRIAPVALTPERLGERLFGLAAKDGPSLAAETKPPRA